MDDAPESQPQINYPPDACDDSKVQSNAHDSLTPNTASEHDPLTNSAHATNNEIRILIDPVPCSLDSFASVNSTITETSNPQVPSSNSTELTKTTELKSLSISNSDNQPKVIRSRRPRVKKQSTASIESTTAKASSKTSRLSAKSKKSATESTTSQASKPTDKPKKTGDPTREAHRLHQERMKVERQRLQEERRQLAETRRKQQETRRLELVAKRRELEERWRQRQQRQDEAAKRRAQLEQDKHEEKRKREEEKRKREEERKRREDEKELEKKRKEEDRIKREEEKAQREAEKKRDEDSKAKREEKQRAVLAGFLVKSEPKKTSNNTTGSQESTIGSSMSNTINGADQANNGTINTRFMQFELTKQARLAPLHRVIDSSLRSTKRVNVEELITSWQSSSSQATPDGSVYGLASALGLAKFGRTNYLKEVGAASSGYKPLTCPSTWPVQPPAIFCRDGPDQHQSSTFNLALRRHGSRGSGGTVWMRTKLFQFTENNRPAYYGTWRKRSHIVKGRRPWARDCLELDYSVDSDDEWEEEEPGESITHSDNEEEEEDKALNGSDDSEDDEDRFLVPHGYLSDDEGIDEGEDNMSAEARLEMKKLRQRLSLVVYEAAHARSQQRLLPLATGPIWLSNWYKMTKSPTNNWQEDKENVELSSLVVIGGSAPSSQSAASVEGEGKEQKAQTTNDLQPVKQQLTSELQTMVQTTLSIYQVFIWGATVPIHIDLDAKPKPTPKRPCKKKTLPDEALPYLIHLVHHNRLRKPKLAFEFRLFWLQHTTGQKPKCNQFGEWRKFTKSLSTSSSASFSTSALGDDLDGDTGDAKVSTVSSSLVWESLPLSQSIVLNKMAEIAVFENNRWNVNPSVIRSLSNQLISICSMSQPSVTNCDSLSDAEYAGQIQFPPWTYLSDVDDKAFNNRRRSSTTPASCKSTDGKPSDEKSGDQLTDTQSTPIPGPLSGTPLVATTATTIALTPSLSKETGVDGQVNTVATAPDTAVVHAKASDAPAISSVVTAVVTSVDTSSISSSSGQASSSRKRMTLDSFFTPSNKRQRTSTDASYSTSTTTTSCQNNNTTANDST